MMDIIEEITNISKSLNKIQSYMRNLPSKLEKLNWKLLDLEHLIENNTLSTKECYRVVREIKKIRIQRRQVKNDIELYNTFKDNQSKLITIENRQFLLAELNKTQKSLGTKYKNRIYTEEEIKEMLGV